MRKILKDYQGRNCGQAMIFTVIMLGGLILSATAIAGLLTVYQIRQSNDAENSARAFFAADAALEWRLFYFYKDSSVAPLTFSPDLLPDVRANSSVTQLPDGSWDFVSQGFSGNTVRALETIFTQ